jgi:CRP-like cAMP-binding protein
MDLLGLKRLPPALAGRTAHRALARGAVLFRQGDPASAVYVVESGRLSLQRVTADGGRVILHVARAGDSFAEASLFSEVYHCDAIAETAARIVVVPKAALLTALGQDPALLAALTARLAHLVQGLRARLELRNVRSARARVWQALLLAAGGDARTISFDRPLKDLAAEIGLSHEALYRALAGLEAAGRIRRTRRRITLLAPET